MERLYQPDFSCIFGKRYANAFLLGQVDSLVWPIFNGMDCSENVKKLVNFENKENRECFYRRKISLADEKVELESSSMDCGLVQAMDLGREYGISNSDVVNACKKEPILFKAILSYNTSEGNSSQNFIPDIKNIEKKTLVVGIVLYPSYTKLDLTKENNSALNNLLNYCKEKSYFIKIDVGNLFLPDNYPEFVSYEKIKSFVSKNSDNVIILSGLDLSGDFNLYYQLTKYYNNLWLEIDPRTFGGMTPTDCFKKLFEIKGFVQNCWHRTIIGSATPTLEISQMMRGFLEATEQLTFSQKCILRTWAFRNVNRLNENAFKPVKPLDPELFNTVLKVEPLETVETESEINLSYKIHLRSYSVTQLIYLTSLINDIFKNATSKSPNLNSGELFLRTYHTTTSLINNEHEFGNYLDLHYKFAEISAQDSSKFLHTVRALENRADFNHYDHELSTTYGSRELTLPIVNKRLEIGSRENFYIVVTFGPRTFQIFVKVKLLKAK